MQKRFRVAGFARRAPGIQKAQRGRIQHRHRQRQPQQVASQQHEAVARAFANAARAQPGDQPNDDVQNDQQRGLVGQIEVGENHQRRHKHHHREAPVGKNALHGDQHQRQIQAARRIIGVFDDADRLIAAKRVHHRAQRHRRAAHARQPLQIHSKEKAGKIDIQKDERLIVDLKPALRHQRRQPLQRVGQPIVRQHVQAVHALPQREIHHAEPAARKEPPHGARGVNQRRILLIQRVAAIDERLPGNQQKREHRQRHGQIHQRVRPQPAGVPARFARRGFHVWMATLRFRGEAPRSFV